MSRRWFFAAVGTGGVLAWWRAKKQTELPENFVLEIDLTKLGLAESKPSSPVSFLMQKANAQTRWMSRQQAYEASGMLVSAANLFRMAFYGLLCTLAATLFERMRSRARQARCRATGPSPILPGA
eukprot:3329581-Pleurochrysis_carterae.AAC.3